MGRNVIPKLCQDSSGKWINDPQQMAETFSTHFSSKVLGLVNQKRSTPKVHPVNRLRSVLKQRFPGYNAPTFRQDGDWTNIPPLHGGNLLKATAKVGLSSLVHIVNLSIRESTFCSRWKTQLVVPHHKKGDKTA